jgi:hypothetical protein
MKSDNHFVPKVYLRQWCSSPQRVWAYRLLVSNQGVPHWKESWIKGLTKHEHLYTSVLLGEESDSVENWLDRDFETPAAEAIHRAVADERLSSDHWRQLIRFVAAQDVRTPVRLAEHMRAWSEQMPALLQKTVEEAIAHHEQALRCGVPIPASEKSEPQLPLRVSTHIEPGASHGHLKAEVVIGRETWLFGIRRLLTRTLDALRRHHWTILRPAFGMSWLTSDNPVIKLNYYAPNHYDFGGGWGSKGTEIMLPLGPQHLLYARVGVKPPKRGTVIAAQETEQLRHLIAAHAHRVILANAPDEAITKVRPRKVDPEALKAEQEMWAGWHTQQSNAITNST